MPARASRNTLGRLERTSKTGAASDRPAVVTSPMVMATCGNGSTRLSFQAIPVSLAVSGFSRFLTGFRRSRFRLRFLVAVSGCTHGRCSEQHRPCDTQSI